VPLVATNNVHYLRKEDFPIHDLLVCVRTQTTVHQLHPERPFNGENYLAAPEEMRRRFAAFPEAVETRWRSPSAAASPGSDGKSLPSLFPGGRAGKGQPVSAGTHLAGGQKALRYITPALRERIEHELNIIQQLDAADYFLAVWDLVQYAQKHGIRYAGRGSAADSVVVYCLGITNVDAFARGLLFERFLSLERAQKPDIDIDFDARYRTRWPIMCTGATGRKKWPRSAPSTPITPLRPAGSGKALGCSQAS